MVGDKTGAKVGEPATYEENLRFIKEAMPMVREINRELASREPVKPEARPQTLADNIRAIKEVMPIVRLITQHCEQGGCVIIEKRREA